MSDPTSPPPPSTLPSHTQGRVFLIGSRVPLLLSQWRGRAALARLRRRVESHRLSPPPHKPLYNRTRSPFKVSKVIVLFGCFLLCVVVGISLLRYLPYYISNYLLTCKEMASRKVPEKSNCSHNIMQEGTPPMITIDRGNQTNCR